MMIGALAYGFINSVQFNVRIVCAMLLVGGFVLLWVDQLEVNRETTTRPNSRCRCILASARSNACPCCPAFAFGCDRRRRDAIRRRQTRETEFSFWLAMPTMVDAFAFEA